MYYWTITVAILAICVLTYLFHRFHWGAFMEDWTSKTVFITGTDTGFGRKLAVDLDKQGVQVFAGCYTDNGIESLKEIASSRMKVFKLDVTKRESIVKAKEFIEDALSPDGGLWAVVNNAGIFKGLFQEMATLQDYQDTLNVNFFGPLQVNDVFLPLLKKSKGRIINVASVAGRYSILGGPYTASKFALEAYNDGLRRTMRPFGITVSIIEPGFFRTAITEEGPVLNDVERQWKVFPPQLKEEYGEKWLENIKLITRDITGDRLPFKRWNRVGMVTRAMTHAIGSKHAKNRYVIGLDALFLYEPMSYMPDFVTDTIYSSAMWIAYRHIGKK